LFENETEGFIHNLIIAAGSKPVEMEKMFEESEIENDSTDSGSSDEDSTIWGGSYDHWNKTTRHKIYLKNYFKILKERVSIGDCIKKDLHRMNELNLFQSNFAASTGLANLMKYFQNNSEISEIIQTTLQSLEIVQSGYVSKSDEPLLWRINRRFAADYFRKSGITNKVKLHRNNFMIKVNRS